MKLKYITLVFPAFFAVFSASAQINTGMMYDPHFTNYSTRYLPGRLGTNDGVAEINVFNMYAYGSGSTVGFSLPNIKTLASSGNFTAAQVNDLLGQMKTNNRLFFGADFQIFSAAFKVRNKDKKELFSLKIESRDRIFGSVQYTKNMFSLLVQGNKQYAGETVDLSDTRVNLMYMREYALGASVPITMEIGSKKLVIRPAATVKLLQGMLNASTPLGKGTVYTDPNGRYLDFNYNYQLNAAGASIYSNPQQIASTLMKGNGLGWGLDLGLNINWNDFLIIDAAAVDIGAVTFKNNVDNYSRNGFYHYDGVQAQFFNDGNLSPTFSTSNLQSVFNPVHTNNKYTTALGAKLFLQGEVRFQKRERQNKKGKTNTYYRHRVFLTYTQGFQNTYNSTTSPYFNMAYVYSLRNILNLGMTLGFNQYSASATATGVNGLGYGTFNFGPFISVKGGPFLFGFGSNNMTGLFMKKGSGLNAWFDIGFSF